LLDAEAIESIPIEPPIPQRLESGMFGSHYGLASVLASPVQPIQRSIADAIAEANEPKIVISNNGNAPRIACSVAKLVHKDPQRISSFGLWFPKLQLPKTFGVQYIIRAAELPGDIQGSLVFRIQVPPGT
jgi:hypothetical protein